MVAVDNLDNAQLCCY